MVLPATCRCVTANGVVTAADPDDPTLLALAIPADKNTFAVQAVRALPFQSLNAFSPDQVAANIPELQRLSLIRSIVLELQSNLRNNRPFANAVRAVLLQPDKLKDFRTWAKANYPELALSL